MHRRQPLRSIAACAAVGRTEGKDMTNETLTWDKIYTSKPVQFVEAPEPSGWKCEMFGMGGTLVAFPKKDDVPNAFWRWMQRICFGNKWSKIL